MVYLLELFRGIISDIYVYQFLQEFFYLGDINFARFLPFFKVFFATSFLDKFYKYFIQKKDKRILRFIFDSVLICLYSELVLQKECEVSYLTFGIITIFNLISSKMERILTDNEVDYQ